MAWTYSGDPASSLKDRLRFVLADTDSNDPLLQDEEINFTLDLHNSNVNQSAYTLARNIATKFGRMATLDLGQAKQQYQDQAKFYLDLSATFKAEVVFSPLSGTPENTPEKAKFGMGMMDNETSL